MEKDPTLDVKNDADEANGETPSPAERYGEPLPSNWIPMYRKPLRTPTRKLRIACIGAGISAMTLAYKIYHEQTNLDCEMVIYEGRESMGGTAGRSIPSASPPRSRLVLVAGKHVSGCRLRRTSTHLVRTSFSLPSAMLLMTVEKHLSVRTEPRLERVLRIGWGDPGILQQNRGKVRTRSRCKVRPSSGQCGVESRWRKMAAEGGDQGGHC